MRLAYYSPLPPSRSGVADYSALLLPALERELELEVARPRRRPPQADISLYHVGNDPEAHGWIVEALRRRPGVVVLHEVVLHHLVAGLTLARGDALGYLDAMEREAGLVGRLLGYGVLDRRVVPLYETRPQDFPLAGEVLDHATGLVVHSRYAAGRVRELGYRGPLAVIAHPAWPDPPSRPAPVEGDPLFGCFGHLNESKRVPQLLAAFARLRERRPQARLLLVGGEAPGSLPAELPDGVFREPYVSEDRLWSLLAACQACVSLRSPTMGETSGSAVRALSLGKPLVVSETGWFAELPDEVALKVPVDEREPERLLRALELLATEPERRRAMAEAALALARGEHALPRVAGEYARVLEEAAGGEVVRDAVVEEVAAAAAEVGIGVEDPETRELADALRGVGLAGVALGG